MKNILLDAAAKGKVEKISTAFNGGAQVDCVDDQGRTSLMLAAKHGHTDAVRILLENQASVNQSATYYGWPALAYAANGGYIEVVRLLLDHEANKNAKAERGKTAFMLASDRGHAGIVAPMLERGSDPDPAPDYHGWTPLNRARKNGHSEVVGILLGALRRGVAGCSSGE